MLNKYSLFFLCFLIISQGTYTCRILLEYIRTTDVRYCQSDSFEIKIITNYLRQDCLTYLLLEHVVKS